MNPFPVEILVGPIKGLPMHATMAFVPHDPTCIMQSLGPGQLAGHLVTPLRFWLKYLEKDMFDMFEVVVVLCSLTSHSKLRWWPGVEVEGYIILH